MSNKLGVGYASVTDLEKQYVLEALDSQRLSQGKFVAEFEKEFAQKHSQKYGVMCNSGTSALHIALEALKESEGWDSDTEILVPALTFIATSNAVIHAGMKPVFVDVDSQTYNIDSNRIKDKITSNTKCIIPVHTFGMPCEMDEILLIAKKHNLKIIEDCAESHFAKYHDRVVGSYSDIMASSTYVAHTITTGIGGIACTSNDALAEIMRSLVSHGRACTCIRCLASDSNMVCPKRLDDEIDRRFRFERIGYSYRVGEIEGALGLAQLQRVNEILNARKVNAELLLKLLKLYDALLQLPVSPSYVEHTYMMFPIVIKNTSKLSRDKMVSYLESKNIETRPMLPLLNQPIYKKHFGEIENDYPNAKYINKNGFYMGCHHGLNEKDIKRIAEDISSYIKEAQ